MNTVEKIKCPKCGMEIDVNTALSQEIEANILKDKEEEFNLRLTKEKEKLRNEITKEKEEGIKSLKESLKEKSEQVKELNKFKSEVEMLKLEKDEIEARIKAEKDEELSKKIKAEREANKLKFETEIERIKKEATEENILKIEELKKKLDDQTALAEEMKRKAEQGSMQLQGEVQEIVIEDVLRNTFRYDIIEPVPIGINGADIIHRVNNNSGKEIGIIVYESKRTKAFGKDWISKLKEDGARVKADICVLVTEALPEGIDRIGQKDGVWICAFTEFKGLVLVLHDSIIRISEVYVSQTNKGEKTQMLYDYLTSNEFSSHMMSIIEGFTDLQKGYFDERNRMEKIWKTREKQLEKILLNTNSFIGSIKGIAGNSIKELPFIEEE